MKHTQGFRFTYHIPNDQCVMVIKDTGLKIVVDKIETISGENYLTAEADETSLWPVGSHRYQVLDDSGIIAEGDFTVIKNFLLTDEEESIKSKNEEYLEAIEATISGRATSAQSSMSVGDKSISYMTIDELLKLRDYFQEKVDKEKGKYSAGNAGRIKYIWQVR